MKLKPIYIAIGGAVIIIGFAYWCFSSGPCSNNGANPDGTPTNPLGPVGAAISSALSNEENQLVNADPDAPISGSGIISSIQDTVNSGLEAIGNWWSGLTNN
jgi:hypothetical protein